MDWYGAMWRRADGTDNGEGHRLDVTYEYDASGADLTVTGPAGREFKYSYNAAGKPSQLKEALTGGFPDTLRATAVFDGWGRLQSVGGMSYEYNAMGQLSRYTRGSYDVTFNYVNAQGVNDGRLASQTAGGVTTSYSYDFMGRLQSATRAGQWLQQYEFDGFGNLTKRNVTLPGQPPVVEGNYPVNAATNRRTGSGTYDAAGNHVWHPSVVYDTDNRMVAAPGPSAGTVETYSYAPDNRRVVRKVPGASGFTEITLWVSSVRAAKRVVPNGAGGTTDTDVIVYAGRRFYAAGVQATPVSAEGSDRLGRPRSTNRLERTHRESSRHTVGMRAVRGWTTRIRDIISLGAGRFMTADPYLASGGVMAPASWNRYSYVEGDPVNFTDRVGLQKERPDQCDVDPSHWTCNPFPQKNDLPVLPEGEVDGRCLVSPENVPSGCPNYDPEYIQNKLRDQSREECWRAVMADADKARSAFLADLRKDFLEATVISAVTGGMAGDLVGFVVGAGGQVLVDGLYKFVVKRSVYEVTVFSKSIENGIGACNRKYPIL